MLLKILYVLKSQPDPTVQVIMEIQKKGNDLKVIQLEEQLLTYEALIDDIFTCDRVISW